jgi:hypothetical protein
MSIIIKGDSVLKDMQEKKSGIKSLWDRVLMSILVKNFGIPGSCRRFIDLSEK